MASNSASVLATVAAGGAGGTSVAFFAPTGTALPTTTAASLNAAFKDVGYVDASGLSQKLSETSKEIYALGTQVPVRTLITQSKSEFDFTMLETNAFSMSIYYRYPLTGGTAITVGAGGTIATTIGPARVQSYAAVFDIVDGVNAIRTVCPSVQVTGRGDINYVEGEPVDWPVTLTAYPDSTGVSTYTYILNAAIAP